MPWLSFTVTLLLFIRLVLSDSLQPHGLHTPGFPVLHYLCANYTDDFCSLWPVSLLYLPISWLGLPLLFLTSCLFLNRRLCLAYFVSFTFSFVVFSQLRSHLSSILCSAPFPRFLDKWLFSRSSKVGLEIIYGTVKKPGTLKSLSHTLWLCLLSPTLDSL